MPFYRQHLDILRQDLRYTARTLLRAPGFTLTAIVVTALSVGATTAAFTLADYVLVRPLPFRDPDRLVKILEGSVSRPAHLRGIRGTNNVSPANFLSWREMSSSFAAMGAYAFVTSNLVGSGEPERLDGVSITYDALDLTGVRPAVGRALTNADDQPGAPCSVLISDGFWRRRFGGDASIVGRTLVLDDESCVVSWRDAARLCVSDKEHRVLAAASVGSRPWGPRQPLPVGDRAAQARRVAVAGRGRSRRRVGNARTHVSGGQRGDSRRDDGAAR